MTPARAGSGRRWARPRAENGRLLRAGIYRRHGPWNPSPLAAFWAVPAAAKIAGIAILTSAVFLGTSPNFIAYLNGLPDARLVAARPLTQDTLIYASDGVSLLADLHPA